MLAKVTKGLFDVGARALGLRARSPEPPHSVEELTGHVELRRYGQRVVAETIVAAEEEVARRVGFARLAGYIHGGNRGQHIIPMTASLAQQTRSQMGEQIAMTVPVSQRAYGEGRWLIGFLMPADRLLRSLPRPDNALVTLAGVPAETVAVRRFSGSRSSHGVAFHTEHLMSVLHERGLEPAGPPAVWFYDPPWTFSILRRNEIAVPVEVNH